MRSLKQKLALFLVAIFPALAIEAKADVGCAFTVSQVNLDSWGTFYATLTDSSSNSYTWWFCSVAGSVSINNGYNSGTLSSDACKSTFSQFLTARATARPMTLWFHGPASCSPSALPPSNATANPYPTAFVF